MKDLRFTDETFKMICEVSIPSHDEVEKCYSLLHPSKLREDYENVRSLRKIMNIRPNQRPVG